MRYNFACTLASLLGDPRAALAMLGPVLERDARKFLYDLATDPDLAGCATIRASRPLSPLPRRGRRRPTRLTGLGRRVRVWVGTCHWLLARSGHSHV